MASDGQESFVRWQGITREYFTTVSNLVLGLATGLLAFLIPGLTSSPPATKCLLVVGSVSLVLLASSVGLAIWCAINRLRDFRATAQIARARSKNESVCPDVRLETKIMGQLSWRLFWCQLALFGFGAVGIAVMLVAKLWAQLLAL